MAGLSSKGEPVRVFERQVLGALSDVSVDCRRANAVAVQVTVQGTTPSATLSVQGGPTSGGPFLALSDPQATQYLVTANRSFDCSVGAPFVRLLLSGVSGTFAPGQGYTVDVTPYQSPGGGRLSIRMG